MFSSILGRQSAPSNIAPEPVTKVIKSKNKQSWRFIHTQKAHWTHRAAWASCESVWSQPNSTYFPPTMNLIQYSSWGLHSPNSSSHLEEKLKRINQNQTAPRLGWTFSFRSSCFAQHHTVFNVSSSNWLGSFFLTRDCLDKLWRCLMKALTNQSTNYRD